MNTFKKRLEHSYSLNDIELKKQNYNIYESDIKYPYIETHQKESNLQHLLDFISDKNKLSLKSKFDHKGSEEFLSGKSLAMEKIELNESILETDDSIKVKKKNICNYKSVKFNDITIKKIKNDINKDLPNEIRNKSTKKSNIKKGKKNCSKMEKKSKNEEISKNNESNISKINERKNHKILDEKIKNKNINSNDDSESFSFNSLISVNSKLFNNNKEWEKSKKMASKNDIPIFEEIVLLLKSKKE